MRTKPQLWHSLTLKDLERVKIRETNISLKRNVGLTKPQAVKSNLSVVKDISKKICVFNPRWDDCGT